MTDLVGKSARDLLERHASAVEELLKRGILRSWNNPAGDLAGYLFCEAYGWKRETNPSKSFGATDSDGLRYRIKGRRIRQTDKTRQLSQIRNMDEFHVLAAVLFDERYRVYKAALVPKNVLLAHKDWSYVKSSQSHRFLLRDELWNIEGVIDAAEPLRDVMKQL